MDGYCSRKESDVAVNRLAPAPTATWYPGDREVVAEVALQVELAACRLAAVRASGCDEPRLAGIECELRRLAETADALVRESIPRDAPPRDIARRSV